MWYLVLRCGSLIKSIIYMYSGDQMSIETRENTIGLQYDVKPQLLILRLAELQLEIVLAGRVPDLARDPI